MNKAKHAINFLLIGTLLAFALSIMVSYSTKYFLHEYDDFQFSGWPVEFYVESTRDEAENKFLMNEFIIDTFIYFISFEALILFLYLYMLGRDTQSFKKI